MEVKPVGRERDKQIAGLRGDCVEHEWVDAEYDHVCRKCKEIRDFTQPLDTTIPEYSTSITDAWPLWEEMKKAGVLIKLLTSMAVTEIFLYPPKCRMIYFKGNDVPEVISGASVLWKIK